LRFLMTDMDVRQTVPSGAEEFGYRSLSQPRIVAYTDASHAPFRATKRKSISGGCLSFLGSTIKTYARHQQSVSLSACESEMTGIQAMCQESLVLSKITSRILKTFKAKEFEVFLGGLHRQRIQLEVAQRHRHATAKQTRGDQNRMGP